MCIRDRGNTTTYTYDIVGRPVKTTYADGTETTVSYGRWDSDGNGANEANKVTTEDGLGRQTIQYYDKQGRLVKETGGGVTVQYEYDPVGNMTKATDGAGRVTTAQYNACLLYTSGTGTDREEGCGCQAGTCGKSGREGDGGAGRGGHGIPGGHL